jgi:hypothetical protein
VAHADGNNSHWQSDVRVTHTYALPTRVQLIYTAAGSTTSQQTTMLIPPGQTVALDDILARWFGADATAGATGILEVRPLDTAGSGRVVASSRLYNMTDKGSYGQFVPAIPFSRFASLTQPQSLIAVAQSSAFRTNFGLVNDNVPSAVALTAFSGAGEKLFETTMNLGAGEQKQLGAIFAAHGIATDDARVELRVLTSGARVFSYASMVDNATGDPSFVMPSTATTAATRLTVPGIGDLAAADGRWQSDVRLYNGGDAEANVSLAFYRQGESQPADVRNITLARCAPSTASCSRSTT